MFDTPSGRFRAVAVAEAISWAGLLLGMFFKYAMGNAIGVHIFGSVHGVVFIAYVVLSLLARKALSWDNRTTVWALVASIPPFGSVVFERWATRTGRLAQRAVAISA
jgi:integral membrane protein